MGISLQSNLASLRALRAIDSASSSFTKTLERLASGSRINRPSDDPAGLSVATQLSNRARVLGRGKLNIGDGLSALSIIGGAVSSSSNILVRMAELAEQAANGSLGFKQRKSLDTEFRQLSDELRRIGATTKFNGLHFLEGNLATPESTVITGPDQDSLAFRAASGDGRYVLHTGGDGFSTETLVLYDRVTQSSRTLASGELGVTGQIAADGKNVYYTQDNQIYRYEVATGLSTRISNATTTENYRGFSLSADGRTLVFTSFTNYQGSLSNPVGTLGVARLYALDTETGQIRTVISSIGADQESVRVSSDGTKVGLYSRGNFVGQNGDGNAEIYSIDIGGENPVIRQLSTSTGGPVFLPLDSIQVANDGRVFLSDNRNFGGTNPEGTYRMFSFGIDGSVQNLFSTGTNLTAFKLTHDNSALMVRVNGVSRYDFASGSLTQVATQASLGSQINSLGGFSGDGLTMFSNITGVAFDGLALIDLRSERTPLILSSGFGAQGSIEVQFESLRAALVGLGGFTLTSASSARAALDSVKGNIQSLAGILGTLGAAGSRLEIAEGLSDIQGMEAQTAASRIKDADIAGEAARLISTQILQQTATAILSQANTQPQLALLLLGRGES